MADVVENRVVEMQFDNKDFEQGVTKSLSTLDKLKEALTFKNASKGFTEVQNGIRSLDFSPIQNSLHNVEDSFMTLWGSLKRNFFDQVSNSILNVGKQLYNSTLGQIKTGGQRRAMNIEQAKFKIAGLGEDWDTVYKDMDYAVSGTAYGIDQAANAASQFLASGVEAGDDMKAALRGISGIAAMTSADYDEIANVFTAAAGKGKVQAMELNRISQRGVNAAAAIAQQMGTTEEAVRDMASKGELDFATFAKAMDSAFGEHAKKANETFTGSLSNMKAALSRIGEIFYAPYLEAMIPVYNRLRETIDKVKNSMKESKNKDKESVATRISDLYHNLSDFFLAWTDTWEPALDRLPKRMDKIFNALGYVNKRVTQMTDVLTFAYDKMSNSAKSAKADLSKLTEQEEKAARDIWIWGNWGNGEERVKNLEAAGLSYERTQAVVEKIVDGSYDWDTWICKIRDDISEMSVEDFASEKLIRAYTVIKDLVDAAQIAFKKMFKAVRAAGKAMMETFTELDFVIEGKVGTPIEEATKLVKNFISNFSLGEKRMAKIKHTFKGVFALIKLGSYIVASLIKSIEKLTTSFAAGSQPIMHVTAKMGDKIFEWVELIMASGKIPAVIDKVVQKVSNMVKKVGELLTGEISIKDFLADVFTGIKDFIVSTVESAADSSTILGKVVESVMTFVLTIYETLKELFANSDFSFGDWFKGIFKKEETDESSDKKGVIAKIKDKIAGLQIDLEGLWATCKSFVSSIGDGVAKVWNLIKNQIGNLDGLFTSIFKFATKIFENGAKHSDGITQNFMDFSNFVTTCFNVAREILFEIKDPLKDILKSIAEAIAGVMHMFAGITEWVGNDPEHAYGAAAFFALIKLIEKIVDYKAKKKMKDSILYNIAVFFDDMKKTLDEWKKEKLWRIFEILGDTMIKIAVAMFIIIAAMTGLFQKYPTYGADAALQGFLYMFAFLASIFAIMALSQNIFKNPIDMAFLEITFKSISTALLFISIGLALIMSSTKGLSTGSIVTVMTAIILMIAEIFAAIAFLIYKMQSWSADEKKLATVSAFMTAFAVAIKKIMTAVAKMMAIMVAAVKLQGGDKAAWDNTIDMLIASTAAVGALMIAMGAALWLLFSQGQKMPDSKALLSLSAMLLVFAFCVSSIVNSVGVVLGLAAMTSTDSLNYGLAFVTAIMLLTMALVAIVTKILATSLDPSGMAKALLGISAMLLILGQAIESIAIAAAIIAVSGVTNTQLEQLTLIVGIIALLMIALTGLGVKAGAGAGSGLIQFAIGLVAIATSIYLINAAIYTIVKAITLLIVTFVGLAEIWPSIRETVPGMLRDLEQVLPRFIRLIGQCIVALCEVIIEAAPLIAQAISAVIVAAIEVTWGYIPGVVDSFLKMLDRVCDLLLAGAGTILPKLILLLLIFIEYIDANALLLGYLLADVLCKVLWGALMAIGDFLTDVVLPWLSDWIDRFISEGFTGVADRIVDAMLSDEEVVKDDRIVLRDTGGINVTTGGTFRYYNPKTDKYYDTLEEAENAQLNEWEEEQKNKRSVDYEFKAPDVSLEQTRDVTVNTNIIGKYEEKSGYKAADSSKLKEAAGGFVDTLKDTTGLGKKTSGIFSSAGKTDAEVYSENFSNNVSQDAYIAGLQKQDAERKNAFANAGKQDASAYMSGQLEGAMSATDLTKNLMGNVQTPEMSIDTDGYKDLMGDKMAALDRKSVV